MEILFIAQDSQTLYQIDESLIEGFNRWLKAFRTTRYEETAAIMALLLSVLAMSDRDHQYLHRPYELYATFFQAITLDEFLALKPLVEEVPVPYDYYGQVIRV